MVSSQYMMIVTTGASGDYQITEMTRTQVVYAALCMIAGICLLLASLLIKDKPLPFVAIGLFLVIGGIILLLTTENITTTVTANGLVSIRYKRIIGRKVWLRRFWYQDIESINLLKGFKNVGSAWSMDKLFLKTTSQEVITIGSRYQFDWRLSKRAIPLLRKSTPIDTEAEILAQRIGASYNVFTPSSDPLIYVNFLRTNDKMRAALQRPSQAQLDSEFHDRPMGGVAPK